ncbi:helix-turn-helix transcriptional regulator [Actinomadura alba]|uniref:Helix-turn-helix transcriptional regulator n=1 Tax=Actinomadura alba TaxID=406431 RepID=A0ABR7LH54_9ACTN|nr:helix-turn-helix transcriptional regulator [Actinomadura alba]
MDGVKRWADIKHKHIARVGAQEVAEGRDRLLAQARGHRLAETRQRRGMTQAQVADAMGVTASRVSQIERGEVTDVGVDVISRYIIALGGRLELVADFGTERMAVG